MGIGVGACLFYLSDIWKIHLESFIKWGAITSFMVLIVIILAWLLHRWLMSNVASNLDAELPVILTAIGDDPSKITNINYIRTNIFPIVMRVAGIFITWMTFSYSIAIGITVIANFVLIATLAVQYLSAERLESQNRLIARQNELITIQTDIIRPQSDVTVSNQIMSLDSRITDIRRDQDELYQIKQAATSKQFHDISLPDSNYSSRLSPSDLDPCVDFSARWQCQVSPVYPIAYEYNRLQLGETASQTQIFMPAFLILAGFLQKKNEFFVQLTDALPGLKGKKERDEISYVQQAVDRIGRRCQINPELARSVASQLSLARVFEVHARAYGPAQLTAKWSEDAKRVPQIRLNTQAFHINFVAALEMLAKAIGSNYDPQTYTLKQFSTDLEKLYMNLSEGLDRMSAACTSEVSVLFDLKVALPHPSQTSR